MEKRLEIKKSNIPFEDVESLACVILGIPHLSEETDTQSVNDWLEDELNIDLETLHKVVNRLIPLCDVAKSDLTGIQYRGFAVSDGDSGLWVCKEDYFKHFKKEKAND